MRKVNKILHIHAGWLWTQGYYTIAMECFDQAKPENDKRDKKGKKHKVRNKKGQFIKYENNNIGATRNGKDNNSVKFGR